MTDQKPAVTILSGTLDLMALGVAIAATLYWLWMPDKDRAALEAIELRVIGIDLPGSGLSLPKPLLTMSLKPAYANLATRYHDLMLAPGSRDAVLARMAQTMLVDPIPILKKITAPTLLVWGEQDGMIPFANSNDYLKAIAGSKRVSFRAVGHLPHKEVPGESMGVVRAFLPAPNA